MSNKKPLAKQLLNTTDQQEITKIINLFNLDLKKREAIRASTYSDLQDVVTKEISNRLTKRSGEFSNKELLDYLTTFDNIVNKNKVDKIDVPQIAIQQNINISGNDVTLDRSSRAKIQEVINAILKNEAQEVIIDDAVQ